MNPFDTFLKRTLINVSFGSGILLILILVVVFRYYIDKQANLNMNELNQIVEKEIRQNNK
jgi:hypothetical protein